MSTIGERLKEERVRLAMSQIGIAAIGGVGKTTQINYEKGLRTPDAAYLAAVAAALEIDVLYVVTGQRSTSEAGLAPDEAALVDNYRASSQEQKSSLKAVGDAFAKSESMNREKKEAE